ncbi:PssD/Cps14F family polysaccharide biosynthesis glycosyltransferase [Atopococcus tabaci]|uniref:PssD/Cps14F family polysaccharide biosynthesis glycosyltransferase n=1 Tax=Atopococcus tabaci TaxID=269774 RepID=UPI00048A3509|nr:PssD/Cps14F family polysaccharide biosynthesis glycosyltransferase [Atopococcus tabaci]
MENGKKICFIASSGGHYEQLLMLKPLMKKYSSIIVTEKTEYNTKFLDTTYYIPQMNRREKYWNIKMIKVFFISLYILLKEKPDIVISTGVLATVPLCILAKIGRKKLIYIESFAKINSPTITGKLLYKFADRFYIQWETLQKFYPKAIYVGSIY